MPQTTAPPGSREVKVALDPELAQAIALARRQERTTSAGYLRNAAIRALREGGFLPIRTQTTEASR